MSGHNHDRKLSVIRTGSQFRNTPLGRLIIIQIYDEDFTKKNTERSPQDANVFKEEKDNIIKLPKTASKITVEKKSWRRLWQVLILKRTTFKKKYSRGSMMQYDAWINIASLALGHNSHLHKYIFWSVTLCKARAANFTGGHLRVQKGNDLKHNVNAAQEFLKVWKWNILQWPGQWPDLNLILLHFTCLKKKEKRSTNN